MEKVRKFDGIWNAERILRNILCYANEKGFIEHRSDGSFCVLRFASQKEKSKKI